MTSVIFGSDKLGKGVDLYECYQRKVWANADG